jgi:hypothetical protein
MSPTDPTTEQDTEAVRIAACRKYLAEMFPDLNNGVIRFALSDPSAGWREQRPFRPGLHPFIDSELDDVLDSVAAILVRKSETSDTFICPYPLQGVRRKGNASVRTHVHADVDGPLDLDRVREFGGMAVASGSTAKDGRPHGHVYLRLARSVDAATHTALCGALGRAVGGPYWDESKCLDNDVLRPPGTLNHKHGRAAPVAWLIAPDDPSVRTWEPEELARALGVPWPVPGDDDEVPSLDGEVVPDAPADDEAEDRPATGAALDARLDGLARTLRSAEPGTGNATLNWAAGVAAALGAGEDVRRELVAVYVDRHPDERGRRAEGERTALSGWRWGLEHPDEALRGSHGPVQAPAGTRTQTHVIDAGDGLLVNEETGVVMDTDDGGQTPDGASGADDDSEFWQSRPMLAELLQFARARRIGPWALLGAVLARAAAAVTPRTVIPPTINSRASLNLFVGLVGESGSGKSGVMDAAQEFLTIEDGLDVLETSPGSGEGLIAAYGFTRKGDHGPEFVQTRPSVLLMVDEVDGLGALVGRSSSTLLPTLKSAWSGRMLGNQNAEAARLRRVEAHAYRLAIVAGVQPERADVLLDDAAGGFPQRWLWMPTYDAGRLSRRDRVPTPAPWRWHVPCAPRVSIDPDHVLTWTEWAQMALPDEAIDAILDANEAKNHPIGAPCPAGDAAALDGHALLTRTKVACLLALLDGRDVEVTPEDWHLAGKIMRISDETRAAVLKINAEEARKAADKRAERAGRSQVIAEDVAADERVVRAMAKVREALADGKRHPARELKNGRLSHYRQEFDEAVERLAASGMVEQIEENNARGKSTVYLTLVKGATA